MMYIKTSFFPAVAVASFTGPSIVDEFSFYQASNGQVITTGAFQKGLLQDREYEFRLHQGSNCENLGEVVIAHTFETMHVLDIGGALPIRESLNHIHLTGEDGCLGLPWVLSDGVYDLACVVLKGHQTKESSNTPPPSPHIFCISTIHYATSARFRFYIENIVQWFI